MKIFILFSPTEREPLHLVSEDEINQNDIFSDEDKKEISELEVFDTCCLWMEMNLLVIRVWDD